MNQQETIDFKALNNLPHWYALKIKNRHEKKVDFRLNEKGITSYLPLNTLYRRWSDRYKKVTEPLFSCYLFVYTPLHDRLHVLQTDGVLGFVCFNGKPATIPEKQINSIKIILAKKPCVEQVSYFTLGKRVRIKHGDFKGIEGILTKVRNNFRFVICVDGIKQGLAIEIHANDLELI
jgi:transcription antitermination factor NusG